MNASLLLQQEHIITESGDKTITLTNFRVRRSEKSMGHASLVSILLESVTSVHVLYISKPWWIWLGISAASIGFFGGSSGLLPTPMGMLPIIIALICVAMYFFTRRHYVSIDSAGGAKVQFRSSGMSTEDLHSFINKVEDAVRERRESLS